MNQISNDLTPRLTVKLLLSECLKGAGAVSIDEPSAIAPIIIIIIQSIQ